MKKNILIILIVIATVLVAILPMGLSPVWNGEQKNHHDQYEVMAHRFKAGYISFGYQADPKLENMDNPYDTAERARVGAQTYWDHAYYKGKYYMYFGVAPLVTTFLPYLLVTGHDLNTYHATQIYTVFYIIGVFLLFNFIKKHFFDKETDLFTNILASVFSLLSIWIIIQTPALYCTAISCGLMFSIFSIYFFLKATFAKVSFNKKILLGILGGFCGAMIFASRPPMGFVNLLFIPLFIIFLKINKPKKIDFLKIALIFIPYILIGTLLMIYNYARFDSIFEFGQRYQITLSDQSGSINIFDIKTIKNSLSIFKFFLFDYHGFSKQFPFIEISGIFINFPILLFSYLLMINKEFRRRLKIYRIYSFYLLLLIVPILILLFDATFAPYKIVRYHLDVYFFLIISNFIAINVMYRTFKNNALYIAFYASFVLSIISLVLLFFVPYDANYFSIHRDILDKINDMIPFLK